VRAKNNAPRLAAQEFEEAAEAVELVPTLKKSPSQVERTIQQPQ
jgi:hypothetical protein